MKAFKKTSKIIAMASVASLLTISAALAQEVYVEGWVMPTKGGFELMTDSGPDYKLEGKYQELSQLAPRHVRIIGDMEESGSGQSIKIETVEDASY